MPVPGVRDIPNEPSNFPPMCYKWFR